MQNLENPFLIGRYACSKYFCGRQNETQKLIEALENGSDVKLTGPLGIGKTWLIQHAFSCIKEKDPEATCIYVDLTDTSSANDLTDVLMNAILVNIYSSIEERLKVAKSFGVCRPEIYVSPVTGEKTIKLNIDPLAEKLMLQSALSTLKYFCKDGNRVYVAFDEFQQITEYPQKYVETLIHSCVNSMPQVNFIFAGSKEGSMHDMFYKPSRPFYQPAEVMHLCPISKEVYYIYCKDFFDKAGKTLEEEAFDYVYDSVMGHTWYIQCWMNRLYGLSPKIIDIQAVKNALSDILEEQDDDFYTLFKACTKAQKKVLKGIAKIQTIKMPLNSEQIATLGMGPQSTVRSCIKTLDEKEFLLEYRESYSIYNRFFALWLNYIN